MSRAVHLGLDIGGTASRWVACGPDGAVLLRGKASGATGHIFNPSERACLRTALESIAKALGDAGLVALSVTAGVTGFGAAVTQEGKTLMRDVFGMAEDDIILVDDIVLAYMAHFEPGEGHLVSAGTGSIGVHIAGNGTMVRVGGRGILIDDAGSGSWIALRALDHIYRVFDHDGSFDRTEHLARHLFALVDGSDWSDTRQFVYGGDRGRIGTLAVAVARAAEEGDQMALGILRQAGSELARLGMALLSRAGSRPIRFVGGVLDLHPIVFAEIEHRLKGSSVSRADGDAALIAARLQTAGHPTWKVVLTGL